MLVLCSTSVMKEDNIAGMFIRSSPGDNFLYSPVYIYPGTIFMLSGDHICMCIAEIQARQDPLTLDTLMRYSLQMLWKEIRQCRQ